MQTLPETGVIVPVTRVRLFGDARVEDADGQQIRLSPFQLALITTVYGHGRKGLTRLAAADLLWGRAPAHKKRQRMRQLLHDVHARLGSPVIDTAADLLRPLPRVQCDLRSLEHSLAEGCLSAAVRILRLGFASQALINEDAFEDWRESVEARLVREVRSKAAQRWTECLEGGDWSGARDAAEALYAIDESDPRAIERVMEARGRTGRVAEAEAAYERYLTSIPEGSDPAADLADMIERVRRSSRVADGEPDASNRAVRFVGRQPELSVIRTTLDRAATDGFEVVIISGESGIGKTRLLDEVHREGIHRGFRCLRAQPVELEQSIPLNPILDALRGVELQGHLESLGGPWSSVIAGLLPPGTLDTPPEDPPPIRSSSLSRRLLDSFALLFEQLSRTQPTLLMLDDLHWADATTLAALQFMQRRWAGDSMAVFATVRPELVRGTDPVAKYIAGAQELGVKRVEVHPLETADALDLIRQVGGGKVSESNARRLCDLAGHHPLYVTELASELLAGRLTLPRRPSDQVLIPSSLGHMLDGRLTDLDAAATSVAGLLAIAGRPLLLAQVAELAGLPIHQVANAVEVLIRLRFVEAKADGVSIKHDLFRSAIYRHISEPRRALHHGAIAEWLLREAPAECAEEAVIHFARAGKDQLAAEYGWAAAERALKAGAVAEAVGLFEIVADREHDRARKAEATAALARALELTRDITRATPQLSLAAERLRSTGSHGAARRLEIKRIEALAELAAHPVQELCAELAAIKAEAHHDRDWESLALALDAELHLLHRGGDVQGIEALLEEMREVAFTGCPTAQVLCQAGLALGIFFGHAAEALGAARRAVQLAHEPSAYRLRALIRLMVVLQARGLLILPEAQAPVEEARLLAQRSGDLLARFSIESNLAVAHLDAGDIDGAEVLMSRVGTLAGEGEMDMNRFIQAYNEGELLLARSDLEGAARAFTRASDFLGPTIPTYMRDLVNAGLGLCALETGDLAEARTREQMLSPMPESWYFDPTTLIAFRTRLLERRGELDEAMRFLRQCAEDLDNRLVTAWVKVMLLQVHLLSRTRPEEAQRLSEELGQKSRRLGLQHREREFGHIALRLQARNAVR